MTGCPHHFSNLSIILFYSHRGKKVGKKIQYVCNWTPEIIACRFEQHFNLQWLHSHHSKQVMCSPITPPAGLDNTYHRYSHIQCLQCPNQSFFFFFYPVFPRRATSTLCPVDSSSELCPPSCHAYSHALPALARSLCVRKHLFSPSFPVRIIISPAGRLCITLSGLYKACQ